MSYSLNWNSKAEIFVDVTDQYKTEFEKFKKEGQEYVESFAVRLWAKIEEHIRKNTRLQRHLKRVSISLYRILGNKIRNWMISWSAINYCLSNKSEISRTKQETKRQRKFNNWPKLLNKNLDCLMKTKETVSKRNNDLLRALQDKDREILELQKWKGWWTDKSAPIKCRYVSAAKPS